MMDSLYINIYGVKFFSIFKMSQVLKRVWNSKKKWENTLQITPDAWNAFQSNTAMCTYSKIILHT